jgi:TonB family protein
MNAIRLPRLVSQPSQGKWTSFTPDVERVIQDDIARTRRLDGVENASAEVNDYVFPNGVVGKSIVYRVIERDQRATGTAPQPAQGADGTSQSRFVRTDLVLVDVTVKDAQGQPVEGLLATDFRVTEDNVERAVEMFEYRSLPAGSYYLLGFRQANSVPNGKFRRISVQVNRPGVRVENRQGYYANRDDFSRDTYAEDMPGVVAPIVRERREPIYPAAAATGRIQGSVVVEAVVGIDGRVIRARVATPFDPKYGLDEAAVQAVQAWTFTPGEFNGMKVPVLTRVVVSFQLH